MGDILPSGDPNLTVFIVMTLLGFLVGALGHLYKSTAMIVTGIVLILAATIVLPLLIFRGGS